MSTSRLVSFGQVLAMFSAFGAGALQQVPGEVALVERLRALPPGPRLFIAAGGEEGMRRKIAADPLLGHVAKYVMKHADEVLAEPVVERKTKGRRLLQVSRDALGRMMSLGYAYRMTGEMKYADKARAEMAAICAFSDFNPSHFLDVGEMTAALGVGLDWFGGVMSDQERRAVRRAIVEKGIGPSFVADGEKEQWWVRGTNNWNQVCHGGLVVGALAIANEEPELAAKVILRAVESLPNAVKEYGPDGAYPEGPGYWEYGTTYNVMLLSALGGSLGTDFGLSGIPGFMQSSDYFLHATGPSGNWFNYSDCGSRNGMSASGAAFWFAGRRGDASLLYNERRALARAMELGQATSSAWVRAFNVLLLAWAPEGGGDAVMPTALRYVAGGDTPVAFFRTGWDGDATWVGVKAGTPGGPHGHMDVGQFVIDSQGVRWAEDLGMQEYTGLEAKGIDLWNMKQESGRWLVYRLGAESHNILTVAGEQQRVAGKSEFAKVGENFVVMDNMAVYGGRLAKALRGVKLVDKRGKVRVRDEVVAPAGENVRVRWAFATKAEVGIMGEVVTLTRDGKVMWMSVKVGSDGVGVVPEIRSWPAAGKHDYDVENPGVTMVGFEVEVPAGKAMGIQVDFTPARGRQVVYGEVAGDGLEGWGK